MLRTLKGLCFIALISVASTAVAAGDPPPPPPPPPLEETGAVESPSSGEWSIKGQGSLLDKSTGHTRHPMLSFFLGVPFVNSYGYTYTYYSTFTVGVGLRFYIPIVKEGFLPMLNDSFGIEFGADTSLVLGSYLGFALGLPVEVRWNFHIFPKLEAYAKLGLGLGVLAVGFTYVYPIPVANVGVLFKVNKVLSLRAEIGSPAVKIGLGLAF
jgi:hypothetical protein